MNQIKLTGYLGRDREIRTTKQRTYTARRYDPIAEDWVEAEVTPLARDYALLSLATHQKTDGRSTTTWHRVIYWNAQRAGARSIHLARRGDLVEVIGHEELFRWTDSDGQPREITQIVAAHFRLVAPKPRFQVQ